MVTWKIENTSVEFMDPANTSRQNAESESFF